jgi:hypothetical protein
MQRAQRAEAFLRVVGQAVPQPNQAGDRLLLIRALAVVGFNALLARSELGPPNRKACFFAGSSWRCPPEGMPLRLALALPPGEWEDECEAWPGDLGGLEKYVGLTDKERNVWRSSWRFEGRAFRHYLSVLFHFVFDAPRAFLDGEAPRIASAPSDATDEDRVLLRSLEAKDTTGAPNPSCWTPEVRLPFRDAPDPRVGHAVGVCILDSEVSRRQVVALKKMLPNAEVAFRASETPLGHGSRHRATTLNRDRSAALRSWSQERQKSAC